MPRNIDNSSNGTRPRHCSNSGSKFAVRANPVMVQLWEEDLCSAVDIGDVVNVIGHAELIMPVKTTSARCLGELQVALPRTPAAVLSFISSTDSYHLSCLGLSDQEEDDHLPISLVAMQHLVFTIREQLI